MCVTSWTQALRVARIGTSTADSGLVTGLTQALRDRGWLQHGAIKQNPDTLAVRLRPDLPHARHSFEQALDALFAALTVQALLTDDFKCKGLEHT